MRFYRGNVNVSQDNKIFNGQNKQTKVQRGKSESCQRGKHIQTRQNIAIQNVFIDCVKLEPLCDLTLGMGRLDNLLANQQSIYFHFEK